MNFPLLSKMSRTDFREFRLSNSNLAFDLSEIQEGNNRPHKVVVNFDGNLDLQYDGLQYGLIVASQYFYYSMECCFS